MRTIAFLLSWIFLQGAVLAHNPPQHKRLDGSWYHGYSDNWIEIKDEGRYLSVMGLPPQGKARIFEQEWRGVYFDKKGNKITLEDRNTILYHHRKSGHIIQFRRSDACQTGSYGNAREHSQGSYYDRSAKPGTQPPFADEAFMEGTWRADRSIDIAMVKTREGLKAKYGGTTRWVSYQTVNNKWNEYIDENGNRYLFHNDKSATWYSNNRRNEPIQLKKISNDVKY